jgi:hypothetical protein
VRLPGCACRNKGCFFATLEREVLNRRRFKSQAEAKMAIFDWLEGWYNPASSPLRAWSTLPG